MFNFIVAIFVSALFILSGCGPTATVEPLDQVPEPQSVDAPQAVEPQTAPEDTERLVAKVFWINSHEFNQIPHRFVDAVNGIRARNDLPTVRLSATLTAAARTHSRDMSLQNRPWHFGSNGSSPIDRAKAAGYLGTLLGENISESFESDLETLKAWMADTETRQLILNPDAKEIGIGWHQETKGKIWWTLVAGA